MSSSIAITVLMENSVHARGLMAEHGLSFHIGAGSQSMLFDAGQSALLLQNAHQLAVNLARLDALALSHGHYDHTGALREVLALAPDAAVYAHPAAFGAHYARNPDGTTRPIGMRQDSLEAVGRSGIRRHLAQTMTEVIPGFFLTGEIPRQTDFEDVGGPFVLDQAGLHPDALADDQALFFDTREGVVVLLGCAHAGVVNTLWHVRQLTNQRPIHAVLGGMHLLQASPARLARTIEALRELGLARLGPAHCSGAVATAHLWREFPLSCCACSVGTRFEFHR